MELTCYKETGVTLLDNAFIDQFMTDANGEYVKVYLYLIRAAQGGLDAAVSSIADALDHTEKDILRALRYWQKCGLLTMQEEKGHVRSLELTAPSAAAAAAQNPDPVQAVSGQKDSGTRQTTAASRAVSEPQSSSVPAVSDPQQVSAAAKPAAGTARDSSAAIPAKKRLSAARQKNISDKEEFRQLVFVAEQYFSRPMTSAEINDLMYFYDTLHFSCDLIECLLECCLDKGDRGPGYMESVAQSWYKKGITTPEEAKKENKRHNESYYVILRALGISDHRPVDKEIEVMDRWLQVYGFSTEIICEACERTIMRIHKPEFGYVETILHSWHEKGVRELSDIKALDDAHNTAVSSAAGSTAGSAGSQTGAGTGRSGKDSRSSSSRFSNFEQRSFDWNSLAEQEIVKPGATEN